MAAPSCNIKYFCGQMIAVCWSDLTWQHTALNGGYHDLLLAPDTAFSAESGLGKYSLRNNKESVSQTHFPNTTATARPHSEAQRHQPHPFDYWLGVGLCGFFHAYPFTAHIHNTTPPSQFLFVGQWCSGSDAAVAAASRRQLRTAGTGNLCQSHSPQTAVTKGKW